MVTTDPVSGMPKNTPCALGVPYTPRLAVTFGAVALANVVLEKHPAQVQTADMTKVFGSDSARVARSPGLERCLSGARPAWQASRRLTLSALRSTAGKGAEASAPGNANARSDLLPDEPGGYKRFSFSGCSEPST